ncbi:MAG: pyruvate kinase [Chloroflexota bacterium]
MLRVKIVCTLGPASREPDTLKQLMMSGMNVARLNFSHGDHEYHLETMRRVRQVSAELQKPIAILADLQGPKLRVGKMRAGGIMLEKGRELILTSDDITGRPGRVPIQYKALPQSVQPGERILIDDGLLEVEVVETSETEIKTRVIIGGLLSDNKGMNLPDASLDIPALTEKDRRDVLFALEQRVDWVALSFVRTASEVVELKEIISNASPAEYQPPVISKIEKPEGVNNIDEIIAASDGIMVARGDLGVETSPEAVPTAQKMMITKCHQAAKPVITATQMLDSMIRNPRPTRAEASDVANAVLDGSDGIMLSGETATGAYPVETVQTMAKIAEEAEQARKNGQIQLIYEQPSKETNAGAICHAAMHIAGHVDAKVIVCPTLSGATAKLMAGFRPEVPILAITPSEEAQRQLALYWGVYPLLTEYVSDTDKVIVDAIDVSKEHGFLETGDKAILTAGAVDSKRVATNLLTVRTITDDSSV